MPNDNSEIFPVLKRIEELLTALTKATLSDSIEKHLADPKHRILYEGAGKVPVKELAKKTKFSVGKISNLWKEWAQAGLLVKDGKSYRRLL